MCVIVSSDWVNQWKKSELPGFFLKKKKKPQMDIESDESERWEDFFGKFGFTVIISIKFV